MGNGDAGAGASLTDQRSGPYGRGQRLIESAAVVLYAACAVGFVTEIVPHLATRPLVVLTGALLGYITADLLTGIVHWLADTYGSVTTPLVGPTIIHGFREHHDDPERMLRHDFVETNGASALGALPVALAALVVPATTPALLFTKTALAVLTLAVVATNQFHKWAHAPRVPRVVAMLQRGRLILRPTDHARHHTAPFRAYYCITTGWLNVPFTRLGIFRRIEKAVAALTRRG